MTNPIIKISGLSKHFNEGEGKKLEVLKDINLDIANGEFFVILGPSGSGKSTILRIISGLEKDYTGKIEFGEGIKHSDISFVFQQFALLPWLNVYDNIGLGLTARHVTEKEKNNRITKELTRFGLEKFAYSSPKELSGGMKQRVGIARALTIDPKIIFMDEPFSELDSFTAEELRKELSQIWQERKTTIVMVTHLIPEAIELADRIAVFTPRPGKIEKIVENKMARPRQMRSQEYFEMEDLLYKAIKP